MDQTEDTKTISIDDFLNVDVRVGTVIELLIFQRPASPHIS